MYHVKENCPFRSTALIKICLFIDSRACEPCKLLNRNEISRWFNFHEISVTHCPALICSFISRVNVSLIAYFLLFMLF